MISIGFWKNSQQIKRETMLKLSRNEHTHTQRQHWDLRTRENVLVFVLSANNPFNEFLQQWHFWKRTVLTLRVNHYYVVPLLIASSLSVYCMCVPSSLLTQTGCKLWALLTLMTHNINSVTAWPLLCTNRFNIRTPSIEWILSPIYTSGPEQPPHFKYDRSHFWVVPLLIRDKQKWYIKHSFTTGRLMALSCACLGASLQTTIYQLVQSLWIWW